MRWCCGLDTVAGVPSSGGSGSANPVPLQGLRVSGITAASPTGAIDTTVILYNAAPVAFGSIPIANWVTVTNDANLGTTFEIIEAGFYQVFLYLPITTDWNCGISLNATAAERQTINAEANFNEIYGSSFEVTAPNAYNIPPGQPIIPVTQADIDAGGGRNVIRTHVTDVLTPGTPPPAGAFVNAAAVTCRIFKIAEIDG